MRRAGDAGGLEGVAGLAHDRVGLEDARVHRRLVAAAVAGVAGDALDLDVRQARQALGHVDGARRRALAGAVQADVELDQQRGARAVPAERGGQPLGGRDAVDGHRQLDAVRRDARQPVALLRAERRVVDEDARRAGLVEDLRLAGLGDGQAAGAELDLAHADLGRLVRLGVRPELDAMLVDVGSAGAAGWRPGGRGRPWRRASRRPARAGRPARPGGGACARPRC